MAENCTLPSDPNYDRTPPLCWSQAVYWRYIDEKIVVSA